VGDAGLARRLGLLELGDERRRFVARELAGRLALGEPHRPAGVAKVGVSGVLQQREQLLHLARRRRRSCLLSECHAPSLPARPPLSGMGVTLRASDPNGLSRSCSTSASALRNST
jgi:hypothetical protein